MLARPQNSLTCECLIIATIQACFHSTMTTYQIMLTMLHKIIFITVPGYILAPGGDAMTNQYSNDKSRCAWCA